MVSVRPVAIALNFSVENIQNDVRQKIIQYMKNPNLTHSLTLAPIILYSSITVNLKSGQGEVEGWG